MKVILMGGVGNQLFQLSAALSLARGPIELLPEIGSPRTNAAGLPEVFDFVLPERVSLKELPKPCTALSRKVCGLVLRIHLNSQIKSSVLLYIVRSIASLYFSILLREFVILRVPRDLGFESFEIRSQKSILLGYFQSYRYLTDKVKEELCDIRPKQISKIAEEWIKRNENEQLLAIHFRLGDYSNEPTFGILQREFFEKAIKLLDLQDITKVIVFSDSIDQVSEYIPQELYAQVEFAPQGVSSAETLWIMSKCKKFVIANSSFSWWGAALSSKSGKVVVAPSPWFLDLKDPLDLVPLEWITVNR